MTTTPRWDDERQRWEKPAERPLPEPGEAGVPWAPVAGLAAAVLVGASPGLVTAQEGPPAVASEPAAGYFGDDGNGGETDGEPTAAPSDSSAWNDGTPGGDPFGGGDGGDGPAGDGAGGEGTGGDDTDAPGPDDTATDPPDGPRDPAPGASEEPSPDTPTAPDTAPALDPGLWEPAGEGEDERTFTLVADDRFEAVLAWEEGEEADLDRVLEDRVRVPARDEEAYEEVFSAAEGAWSPGDPAFEFRHGTDPARYALATALARDGRVVTVTLRGPAEAERADLEGYLGEAVASLGGADGG
ncbi:hypothetical protein ACFVWN_23875 [Nocardiopsis flavescens]|uniref:hypothetical protein n=1 Tax=Nocardiopsis flavescens TaxID=758803 RepID=UPI003665A391